MPSGAFQRETNNQQRFGNNEGNGYPMQNGYAAQEYSPRQMPVQPPVQPRFNDRGANFYGNAERTQYAPPMGDNYANGNSFEDDGKKYDRYYANGQAEETVADGDDYSSTTTAEQKLPVFVQKLLKKKQ